MDTVDDLLVRHKRSIEEIRSRTTDAFEECDIDPDSGSRTDGFWLHYDDLFFLRYVVAFGEASDAEKAIRKTVKQRASPEYREIICGAQDLSWREWRCTSVVNQYRVSDYVSYEQTNGGLLHIVRGCLGEGKYIYEMVSREDHIKMYMVTKEEQFKRICEMTKASRLLGKVTTIFDMKGVPLSQMMDKKQGSIYAEVTGMAAYLYPGMEGKTAIINAPSWMAYVIGLFRPIIPKKTVENLQVFSSTEAMWKSKWGKATMARDRAPDFVGGERTDYDEYFLGTKLIGSEESGGARMEEITVPARSSSEITHPVPLAGTVAVVFSIQSYAVKVSVELHHGEGTGDDCNKRTGQSTSLAASLPIRADAGPVTFEWKCTPGVVVIKFDNVDSLLWSRTVRYQIEMTNLIDITKQLETSKNDEILVLDAE